MKQIRQLLVMAFVFSISTTSLGTAQETMKQIVFVSERNGKPQLYLIDSDGTGLRQLTDDDRENLDPVWSPDGSQIVYTSIEVDENGDIIASEIMMINADGTGQTSFTAELRDNGWAAFHPAWSPDGKRIAFDYRDASRLGEAFNTSRIYRLDVSDFENTPIPESISESGVGCFRPLWTSDGRIASECRALMNGGIAVEDTTQDRLIGGVDDEIVGISPVGSYLAYRGNLYGIVIRDLDNLDNSPPDIRPNIFVNEFVDVAIYSMAWSPLVANEAVVYTDHGLYRIQIGAESHEVTLLSSDMPATDADRRAAMDWSSDGTQLVFTTLFDDQQELFVINADGSGLQRLTDNDYADVQPRWRPDGD